MKPRTFIMLFICHAIPLFIGMGLFPLLPLYAAHFGATGTDIGLFYAVVYIASTVGVLATGWLAARISRRWLFLVGALMGPPTMVLMGHATAFWQVVVLTALAWLSGAITLTLLSVFTGSLAEPASRGRVFSLMFLVYPIDALLGGTAVGQLTTSYGYTIMFYALATIWILQPVVGFIGLRDSRIIEPPVRPQVQQTRSPLGRPFILLLASSLLSIACISIGRLGTSLSMQMLGFAPDVVTSTAIVSGLATIPLTLVVGTIADRFGRREILVLSYLLAAGGTTTLIMATQAWQFQLAATLLLVAWCMNRAVASALATDLLSPETLGRGLPWLGSMDSIASIIGFAISGLIIDIFGGPTLYIAATVMALAAIVALIGLPQGFDAAMPRPVSAHTVERPGTIVPAGPAEVV